MAHRFDRKVLLVTGAARGIGAEVARRFVARGGSVALVGLEPELLAALARDLGSAAAWWEDDVRDADAVHHAVRTAAAHFGQLDFVLANAGVASYGTIRQTDEATFTRVIDINLNGAYRTLHAAIPELERSRGYALVVSSLAAFTNVASLGPYTASKAGVEALALATKQEVKHLGIDVGVCHPSWIDTDMVRSAESDLPTFKALRAKMPYPANTTTTVEACAEAILEGLAKRASRVYVPGGVAIANWLEALINSPLVTTLAGRMASKFVPQLEAEAAALGRSRAVHMQVANKK